MFHIRSWQNFLPAKQMSSWSPGTYRGSVLADIRLRLASLSGTRGVKTVYFSVVS